MPDMVINGLLLLTALTGVGLFMKAFSRGLHFSDDFAATRRAAKAERIAAESSHDAREE